MANATPLLRANTGELVWGFAPMTPRGASVVAAKPGNGTKTEPEIDPKTERLPGGAAALVVSTTGAGPHANINANNAVMITPAVVT